jgi:hypothetical protein
VGKVRNELFFDFEGRYDKRGHGSRQKFTNIFKRAHEIAFFIRKNPQVKKLVRWPW